MKNDIRDRLKADFNANREHWISDGRVGQWALLHEGAPTTFFGSYGEAVRAAVESYDPGECLIDQVLVEDRTDSIQHVHWSV